MPCPHCHAEMPAGEPFCAACGRAVAPSAGRPPATLPTCPRCGAVQAADSRFCSSCGQSVAVAAAPPPQPPSPPLAKPCPRCGLPLRPGAWFCAKCGSPAGATAGPPPPPPAARCPRCQAPLEPGSVFCFGCGAALSGGPPAVGLMQTPAGFGRRALAYILDLIVLGLITGIVGQVLDQRQPGAAISAALGVVYILGLWTLNRGQTLGKLALGIRIVRADGRPINVGIALLRYFGYLVNTIPLGLGWLWALFGGRTFADMIAGTRVVRC